MSSHEFILRVLEVKMIKEGLTPQEREKHIQAYCVRNEKTATICSACKKVMKLNDWSCGAGLSHGICFDCMKEHYKDLTIDHEMIAHDIEDKNRERYFQKLYNSRG
jgi:hypothetical protein